MIFQKKHEFPKQICGYPTNKIEFDYSTNEPIFEIQRFVNPTQQTDPNGDTIFTSAPNIFKR